jgi:hypothetical protein
VDGSDPTTAPTPPTGPAPQGEAKPRFPIEWLDLPAGVVPPSRRDLLVHGARLVSIPANGQDNGNDKGQGKAVIQIQTPSGTWAFRAVIVEKSSLIVGQVVLFLWLDSSHVRIQAKPSEVAA